jgi:hypothetical protein
MSESPRRIAAAALGMATICLVWIEEPLVRSRHEIVYHWSGRPLSLFAPVVLDVLVVWLLLALLFFLVRASGRKRVAVWAGIVLFAPSIALKSLRFLLIVNPPHLLTLAMLGAAIVGYVLVLVLWRPAFAERFDRVVGLTSVVLGFVAVPGAVLLCQLVWFGWQARSLNEPRTLHQPQMASTAGTKPRIFWILLDELSFQQVYEHRFQGLQLPAFDALAAQSTVFTHIIPAGVPTDKDVRTEKVLPSLLTGEPVDEIRSSPGGQLSTHNPDTDAWQPFDPHNTVFQDALDAGYSTALAGWFNPYCRILPTVLDRCFWTSGSVYQYVMVPGATVESNMQEPAEVLIQASMLHRFLRPLLRIQDHSIQDTETHISDYRKLVDAADSLLRDRSMGFVLLHLPIPHPGGIYNRTTGQLTTGPATYIDNLALADNYVAHVRSMLEQAGEWDSSTIVIMGDHGWRTQMMWRDLSNWTREEETASLGGGFDDRPAYIVKLPGQQTHATIDTPFRAVRTRKLLDALLTQRIRSTEDLSAWAQQTH